mmetsp:Transcript_40631/g.95480  ORF Transcript_40631/g.95480 Transcript_40631/m.95480 type:complete len:490 (+) Transcript_40631:306-1775(+)
MDDGLHVDEIFDGGAQGFEVLLGAHRRRRPLLEVVFQVLRRVANEGVAIHHPVQVLSRHTKRTRHGDEVFDADHVPIDVGRPGKTLAVLLDLVLCHRVRRHPLHRMLDPIEHAALHLVPHRSGLAPPAFRGREHKGVAGRVTRLLHAVVRLADDRDRDVDDDEDHDDHERVVPEPRGARGHGRQLRVVHAVLHASAAAHSPADIVGVAASADEDLRGRDEGCPEVRELWHLVAEQHHPHEGEEEEEGEKDDGEVHEAVLHAVQRLRQQRELGIHLGELDDAEDEEEGDDAIQDEVGADVPGHLLQEERLAVPVHLVREHPDLAVERVEHDKAPHPEDDDEQEELDGTQHAVRLLLREPVVSLAQSHLRVLLPEAGEVVDEVADLEHPGEHDDDFEDEAQHVQLVPPVVPLHLVDVADDVWDDEAGVVELPEELHSDEKALLGVHDREIDAEPLCGLVDPHVLLQLPQVLLRCFHVRHRKHLPEPILSRI